LDSFPDPHELTDQQLVDLIDVLAHEDHATEYRRGVAQRKVELLRAELTRRFGSPDDDVR